MYIDMFRPARTPTQRAAHRKLERFYRGPMAVIGTAGHVDHGKSSLVQRLTGIDPDRFEEEKRRGLTIDLGFAWLTLPSGREVGIVDVPGHERFIRNMLAGAGGMSACLFVVAANEGWKPQSAEHLAIIDVLGISNGVVALTKSDTVDETALEAVRSDIERRLVGTSLEGAEIVPCSALSGAGLEELKRALDEVVDRAGSPPDESRPRLWVDRVFTITGAGTVVTGTLAGGALHEGDEVALSPSQARARVRSIQTHKKRVDRIGPANRVALNLAGLDRGQTARGDAIVRPDRARATRHVDAVIRVLPSWATGGTEHELTARGSHLMYVGSAEVPVRVRLLGTSKLRAGEKGFARLTLRDQLPLERGDRFVLRDAGRILTFGGGRVLDPAPMRADVDLLEELDGVDDQNALRALVESAGVIGHADALFRSHATQVPDDVRPLGNALYSGAAWEDVTRRTRAALTRYHDEHPLEAGIPRERLRNELRVDHDVFDDLVTQLDDVIEDGRVLRIEWHRVSMTPEQQEQRTDVMQRLEAGGFAPPLTGELQVGTELLRSLVESGDLVRVGDFYLTSEQALRAQTLVRDFIEREGPATVAQIRDLLGTSRKYAVPLCEWLDSTGTTVRRNDVRALGPKAALLPR